MPTYVLLANFTDQGVRNIKDTISRAEAFKEMAKRSERTLLDAWPARCRRRVRGG
jgi:uncharacterized protein with GYD domain